MMTYSLRPALLAAALLCLAFGAGLRAQSLSAGAPREADFRRHLLDLRAAPSRAPEGEEAGKKKSGFLAAFYSLLLPGMGELYAGDFSRGEPNLIADGAMWLGFAGLNYAAGWTRRDGQTFAAEHAGVNTAGKDDQYFVDIGNFIDIHEYNQKKLRDKTINILYNEDPAAGMYWKWDSDANRAVYHDTRVRADQLSNAGRFVIVGLIANRIWSAIRAATMAGDYNKGLLTEAVSRVDIGATAAAWPAGERGMQLALRARF